MTEREFRNAVALFINLEGLYLETYPEEEYRVRINLNDGRAHAEYTVDKALFTDDSYPGFVAQKLVLAFAKEKYLNNPSQQAI